MYQISLILSVMNWVRVCLAYPTLPYPTLPYPTLPYPTLPDPTLPYPTLPFTLPDPTLCTKCSQAGETHLGCGKHTTTFPSSASFAMMLMNGQSSSASAVDPPDQVRDACAYIDAPYTV